MSQASPMIRVVIVEDQWMIRDGLAALADVADNIEVVATGADGREALALVAEHHPDVVLMDIKMPHIDGLEATRRLRRTHPGTRVLILTTFVESDLITEALTAGAAGYLTKDISADELADAVTAAANGLVQLAPDVATRIATMMGPSDAATVDPEVQRAIDGLTPRERDVLRLLATGASNPDIAAALHLSAGTVKNHVSSILRRLGANDRTSAAILATHHRLDRDPG